MATDFHDSIVIDGVRIWLNGKVETSFGLLIRFSTMACSNFTRSRLTFPAIKTGGGFWPGFASFASGFRRFPICPLRLDFRLTFAL